MARTNSYYFSFGTNPLFPYYKGYVVVRAADIDQAIAVFDAYHPRRDGFINCAFVYDQCSWDAWQLPHGKCHAVIAENPCEDVQ